MKITFKNVGQGDSILLEWQKKGESFTRIGVIDCKKIERANPTLEHIRNLKVSKIDFIVLSHPHYDHYSGMLELLEYCETKNIAINYFINSAGEHKSYIKWFEIDSDSSKLLEDIFDKTIELYESGLIKNIGRPSLGWPYKINEDFILICISPSDKEIRLYNQRVDLFGLYDEKKASQAANILATIFLVQSKDLYYSILTSDAAIEAFDRIRDRNMDFFENSKLLLSQIPHHGSKDSHQMDFWRLLEYHPNCPSIVSAGKHIKYNHPHKKVVEDFDSHDFKIYATNFINGVQDLIDEKESRLSSILDMASKIIEIYEFEGDQEFKLTTKSVIYQPSF